MRLVLRCWFAAFALGLAAPCVLADDRDPRLETALERAEAGDSAGAEAAARAALAASASPQAAWDARETLAAIAHWDGRDAEAVARLEPLLDDGAALYGASSPALITAWRMLGASRGNLGDDPGATFAMLKAVQLGRADAAGALEDQLLAMSDLARQFLDTGDTAAAAMLAAEMTTLGRFDDDSLVPEAQDGLPLRALAHLRRGRPVEAVLQGLPFWRIDADRRSEDALALAETLDDELSEAAAGDEAVVRGWIDAALALEPARAAADARQTEALEPMMAAFAAGDPVGADAAARAALDRVLADDPLVASVYYALLLATLNAERPDLAIAWALRLGGMPAGYLASFDNDPVPVLGQVADRLIDRGRAREAAELAGQVLDIAALRDGPASASVRDALMRLGAARRDMGQFPEAEAALRAALALALPDAGRPELGPAQAAVQTLVDLAQLAGDRGDAAAAGMAYAQAQALLETSPAGAGPEGWAFVLDDYARYLEQSGQPEAAHAVASRAVAEISRREAAGRRLAMALLRRGLIELALDRPEAAGTTLAAALAAGADLAPGDLARIQVARARVLGRLGRGDEASASLTALLTLDGGEGVDALIAILEGASATEAAGDAAAAGRLVAQAIAAMPPDQSVRAYAEAVQGQLAYRAGDLDAALTAFRAATLALTQRDRRDEPHARDHLALHVRAAEDRAALASGTEALNYATEAFQVAQRVNDLSAGAALGRATARLLGSGPEAAALARDLDSAGTRVGAAREALLARLGAGDDAAPERAALAEARGALEGLTERLAREFPDYAAFADPRPVDLLRAARLLAPGEVLVLFATSDVTGRDGAPASLAIAIGNGQSVTAALPARAELEALARDLRCAAALTDRACGGGGGQTRGAFSLTPEAAEAAFDYALAHRAYQALLEPLEELTGGATSLILVPDRSLAALPFHLMLTAETGPTTPLAQAPWLIRGTAITVVPTVAGLAGLRGAARASAGDRPYLGIGDPLIGVARRGALPYDCAAPPPEAGLMAAALAAPDAALLRGDQADAAALAALPALPDTRCELTRTAALFGTPDAVLLHGAATETAVKALSAAGELARFRVLSFATHGLIAGEVGAENAGLVLTPPDRPGAFDDGLLTTAEIAELRLDADFVLLSACNTAAGSARSDEGLSGLASAFFLAGARSLLVSHWPVYSDAATRLTSGMVGALAAEPRIGRAEALRRAMLAVLDDPDATDRMRHPAYWAPFMLVGDGAAG